MKIVGVGCGPGLLTEEAIAAIRSASRIYGSGRAIDIARRYIPPDCIVEKIADFSRPVTGDDRTIVLSTGDPMLGGLGYLEGDVIPGVSSLQIAAARLHVPLSRVSVVTAHGRNHTDAAGEVAGEVRRGKIVFLLADPSFDPRILCPVLKDCPGTRIVLCEELGYPGERITVGSVDNPPIPNLKLFSLFIGDIHPGSSGDPPGE